MTIEETARANDRFRADVERLPAAKMGAKRTLATILTNTRF